MKSSEVMNLFSLEGKTALVTGACYGIGFAIATALHGAGAKIAFCATSDASVEKALKAYEAEGITDVKGYACDVTDEAPGSSSGFPCATWRWKISAGWWMWIWWRRILFPRLCCRG